MSPLDVSLRAEVARFLGKECWPATKADLLDIAHSNNASDEVMSMLNRLPEQETFENLAAAWGRLGGQNESRRT